MSIELWSRKEGLRTPPAELVYAEQESRAFPETFRVRVCYWMISAFGSLHWGNEHGDVFNEPSDTLRRLYVGLCEAYGRRSLVAPPETPHERQLREHILGCPDDEVLDLIDGVFQVSAETIQLYGPGEPTAHAEGTAREINRVFVEEGVGYRRVGQRLVRLDDEVVHAQAVVPALRVLATGAYGQAEVEFGDAVTDFARGKWRATLTHANAAFESVLKVVTGEKGTAGELVKAAKEQGLIPKYLGTSADSLAKLMQGLPAARGQQGSAHGLGDTPTEADEHLARLVLTMAAAFIVFLAAARN